MNEYIYIMNLYFFCKKMSKQNELQISNNKNIDIAVLKIYLTFF